MRAPVCLVLLLAGCAAPSPAFRAADPVAVRVSGTTFSVFSRGAFVEVHRHGAFFGGPRGALTARALGAITAATGCPVRPGSLEGDGAIFAAELDCAETKPPVAVPPALPSLDCQPTPGAFGTEYDCIFLP